VTARYPEATGGLLATTQYALKTDNGRDMFNLVAGGFLPETSIGYDALDTEEEFREVNGEKVAIRLLKTIRLWEYSNVIWGMNPATATVSAKSSEPDPESKAASGATDLPIADRDRAWDSAEAIQGIRRVTGSEDEPSDSYRDGFFWFDGEAPELFTSYKLAFADDVGGELTAIPRGIFAVAARLDQTDISDADKEQVRTRVSRYYARMRDQFDDDGIVPPWEKAKAASFDESADLGELLTLYRNEETGEYRAVGVFEDAKHVWIEFNKSGEVMDVSEAKVGRAISAARMERIRGAIDNVQAALSDLTAMLAEVEPSADDTDKQMAAPQTGAADDSDVEGAGPGTEPPTSEADTLMIELLKSKRTQV